MKFLIFTGKVIVFFVALYFTVSLLIDHYFEKKNLEAGKTRRGKWIEKGVDFVSKVFPPLALRAVQ